ncbi:EspG family protein [Actinopolyspora xinjiangensis]|uniref:EspG family protein n=1 Tax=Actinopolyspora xinjiangensis TaxID=405564 RepID=A0A1H0VQA8_9ACTN|nr:ESX secretion-associated protein EspG [Actinopolyspora xinjiangensis]SDP80276.1 EspG family protein [Actinopolyspora xinjiangensis]
MTERTGFTIRGLTLELLGRLLGVPVRGYPLQLPYPGGDRVATPHVAERAHEELVSNGLADEHRLKDEVREAVLLLGEPEVAVGILANDSRGEWLARAVSGGDRVVLAEQLGDTVEFTWLSAEDWHFRLAGMLPVMRPAAGNAVSTTRAASNEPGADEGAEPVLLHNGRAARDSSDMRDVARVFAARRNGSGHFAPRVTGPSGGPRDLPALSWVDTELGCYAVRDEPVCDHNRTTFTPVDNSELGRLLRDHLTTGGPRR